MDQKKLFELSDNSSYAEFNVLNWGFPVLSGIVLLETYMVVGYLGDGYVLAGVGNGRQSSIYG